MKTRSATFATLILVLMLAACAPGSNPSAGAPDPDGEVAGFLDGLWHGLIIPVTFVVSLFKEDLGVYETHNNGGWYDFGFLFGLTVVLGGGGKGSSRRGRG